MLLKKIETPFNPNAVLESVITSLLALIDDDPLREGLRETPAGGAKAWRHWCGGYGVDIAELMKVFEGLCRNKGPAMLKSRERKRSDR